MLNRLFEIKSLILIKYTKGTLAELKDGINQCIDCSDYMPGCIYCTNKTYCS